jgi:hypothetical protein
MERSPSSEANRRSPSQEIPSFLWYLKGHHRVHRSSSLDRIPIIQDPFNLLLRLSAGLSTKLVYQFHIFMRTTCPTHLILLNLITLITSGTDYKS